MTRGTGVATRNKRDIQRAYEKHLNTVYRVCYGFFGNAHDAEDATQETFIRLIRHDEDFRDAEHEKAWLIRVASNVCKDTLKSAELSKRSSVALDGGDEAPTGSIDVGNVGAGGEGGAKPVATGSAQLSQSPAEQHDATLEVVLGLPEKYKDVVYLYYYEGYSTAEVADIVGRPASTVRSLLAGAREILREQLGGDWA